MRESAKGGAWVDDRDILVCKRERESVRGMMRVRERKGEIECARERGRVDERDSEREYEIESARQSTREREWWGGR